MTCLHGYTDCAMAEARTARGVRFGVVTIQNVDWPTMARRWRYLESLGFDTVWLVDHFVNPRHPDEPWFEAWALLAALAAQTERIRIGTLVSPITYRNPAVLARAALTVDHISGGRLELGLGAGGFPLDHTMTGSDVWEAGERVERFREALEIVDRLLSQEVTSYRGRYYTVDGAIMQPRPIQQPRPPITVGAFGRRMLELTAAHADGWNFSTSGGPERRAGRTASADPMLELARERNRLLDERCRAIGRDPAEIRRGVTLAGTAQVVWTSVEQFRELVARYRVAGFDEFVLHWPRDEEQRRVMEQVASEVLSDLRW